MKNDTRKYGSARNKQIKYVIYLYQIFEDNIFHVMNAKFTIQVNPTELPN